MKKRAEEALSQEIRTIITASDYEIIKQSLGKLINLADILDSIGDEKDADRVDQIVKEAAGIWDFLFSGVGGAATTKDQSGKSIIDAIRGGNVGEFFNKDTIVRIVSNFLFTGGIGLLAGELVEVLTQKVPILKWFGDSKAIKFVVEGAITYAIKETDFAKHLVDGFVNQIEGVLGMKVQQAAPPATPGVPTTQPAQSTPPVAQQQAGEGSSTQTFQVASPVPGAKS